MTNQYIGVGVRITDSDRAINHYSVVVGEQIQKQKHSAQDFIFYFNNSDPLKFYCPANYFDRSAEGDMKTTKQGSWNAIIWVLGALVGLLLPSLASAKNDCFPASGKFESQTQPPGTCPGPVFFCTKGSLTGALNGDFEFTAAQLTPANEPSVPAATFYSGTSTVHAHKGDLVLIDTGALDLLTGRIAALLTVIGGTEGYAGASGFLVVHGSADLATGVNTGRYTGEVCVQVQ